MPLKKSDYRKLQEMQDLCTQVEVDNAKLQEIERFLKASEQRKGRLAALYQSDWRRLVESPRLSDGERREIEGRVAPGHYSIFWQDTIWNALSDSDVERTTILKTLARLMEGESGAR